MIFKVLSSVFYCIMEKYVCDDFLFFPKTKLCAHFSTKGFEITTYKTVSVIGIPELLMSIISCHEFVKNENSSVIL